MSEEPSMSKRIFLVTAWIVIVSVLVMHAVIMTTRTPRAPEGLMQWAAPPEPEKPPASKMRNH
jgi:hypothetical protein